MNCATPNKRLTCAGWWTRACMLGTAAAEGGEIVFNGVYGTVTPFGGD